MINVIGPIQSPYHEGSPVGKRSLRWEGFVEKVGFEPGVKGVKEWWMMRVVMMIEMSWQVNEEVSRDMTGEADVKDQGADSRDGVMHIWMRDLWFSLGWLGGSLNFADSAEPANCQNICKHLYHNILRYKTSPEPVFGSHRRTDRQTDTLKTIPDFAIEAACCCVLCLTMRWLWTKIFINKQAGIFKKIDLFNTWLL